VGSSMNCQLSAAHRINRKSTVEIPDGRNVRPLLIMRLLALGVPMDTTELKATSAGETLTIRPIRLTDTAMESDFIRGLSPETKRFRFLGAVRELPVDELVRLCDVDGKHSMAFVATVSRNGREMEIGVSRYAPNSKLDVREIAVAVADEWHHRGVGTLLMKQLIQTARTNGVKQLYSVDLADNAEMRALAKDLGMTAACDPDDPRQVIYSLGL
jgi:GNAT superfamily N-acetyltransferase